MKNQLLNCNSTDPAKSIANDVEEAETSRIDTRSRINLEIEGLIRDEGGPQSDSEQDSGEASEEEATQVFSVQDRIEMEIKEIERREMELKKGHKTEDNTRKGNYQFSFLFLRPRVRKLESAKLESLKHRIRKHGIFRPRNLQNL